MPRDYRFAREEPDELDEDALDREPDDEAKDADTEGPPGLDIAIKAYSAALQGLLDFRDGDEEAADKQFNLHSKLMRQLNRLSPELVKALLEGTHG